MAKWMETWSALSSIPERRESAIRYVWQAPLYSLSIDVPTYLLSAGLKVGDKIRVPTFDPLTFSGQDAVVQY